MRILFATHLRQWGGGEQWMLAAARGLRERGHDVVLCAPAGAEIRLRADEAGLSTLAVEFGRDFDPRSFLRVWRHCRRRRVEVLCLNMDRVLRIAGLAARLAGVPAVIPRRGSEFPLKNHLNYRFQYRCVATAVIVNSQATAAALCRGLSWRPRGAVHVLYNGLDLAPYDRRRDRAQVRRELGLADQDLVAINVGELTRRKNASLLVDAIAALRREFPGLKALLVGEGEERAALAAQIAARGLEDSVRLLGFRRDVPDLLGAADVLVHAASVEGFGYAVAEAMACRLPAVVSRASSLPEVIADGETGRLFTPGDGDDLARALRPYLADPGLRRRHGEAGRRRVEERFSLAVSLDRLEAIFRQEAAGRGDGAADPGRPE